MEYLRRVRFADHVLETWETGKASSSHQYLGYRLTGPDGMVIFEGEDFGCPGSMSIDSDATLRNLLGFLTLRPGDTDEEYFANYTPAQLAWAQANGEELSLWSFERGDFGDDFEEAAFEDLK
jgi:hypothetical protein